ncbi:MAG: aspartate aminotransferase family protein [SAR324 cluster bacterium]|nr:aspartate aminotransferase family protein [SAR324 cluster bacterium]
MKTTSELQQIDAAHNLHPFTDYKDLNKKGSRVITRAEGVYLWDSEGNKILDGMAGLWCCNIGYGRKELVDAAYQQMLSLPYYNLFFQTTHPPAAELSQILSEVTPNHFNHVFFTNSGSEANDTVVRMVRRYWDLKGKADKTVIISRENAYHGSTMAAASLGGMKPMHAQGGLPIPDIVHIQQPHWFKDGGDSTPDEFGINAAQALETKIIELGENRVAAFIGEPVQGAGGVIIPPATYWPEIQRICDKYGILLIADEVICGFGRMGRWFGSDHFQIKADLMPIAKGLSSGYLPIGGVMVSDRVAGVLIDEGGEFYHGFTYSGHPVACAVATENIRIIKEEKIIENVHDFTAPYLQKRWKELENHPLVGEARSIGFMAALELVKDKNSMECFPESDNVGLICRDACFRSGLVMRSVGDTMVISPPLIFDKSHIDELITLALKSLDLTSEKLQMKN